MAGWEVKHTYETIEDWARIRGDHSLLRDKTALAILTLAEILEDKKQSVQLEEILAGAINGVRKDA
ncbi:hypothetical protein [uncultured Mediterranean phage uvDeep-CGR0-KM22-C158]|nr:hypothetical protein [uncultured Mediterranean phage uvDeep-CGR0-KM15-C219]ANS02926.1 hypothetical protein [uncultured Mediterranean phage uvDeep-CGR0-KM22-C158]